MDRKIAEKLANNREQLEREPHTLPADADHLAGLVVRSAGAVPRSAHHLGVSEVSASRRRDRAPGPPTIYRSANGEAEHGRHAHRRPFLAGEAPSSVAGFLRRCWEDARPLDRVVLVTDERVGLPLGPRGREYLEDLLQQGPQRFQTLELTFAEYVELEALLRVVGLAKSAIWKSSRCRDEYARSRSRK